MRRIVVDTEWTAVPWSSDSELLWVGLADESGRTWCALASDAVVHPAHLEYAAALFRIVTPDVPRLNRNALRKGLLEFCGQVDEFWAWIPTLESFAAWSRLGDQAPEIYQRCRSIDLQMLRSVVSPWPAHWPNDIHDLNAAAQAAGVTLPPRAHNHLHPRVHAEWNSLLLQRILAANQRETSA